MRNPKLVTLSVIAKSAGVSYGRAWWARERGDLPEGQKIGRRIYYAPRKASQIRKHLILLARIDSSLSTSISDDSLSTNGRE